MQPFRTVGQEGLQDSRGSDRLCAQGRDFQSPAHGRREGLRVPAEGAVQAVSRGSALHTN